MLRFVLLCLVTVILYHCHAQNDTYVERVLRKKRTMDSNPWVAWTDGTIPYCYHPLLPERKYPIYKAAMEAFSAHTCITFEFYDNCSYISGGGVRLGPGGMPYSYIGKRWDVEDIILGEPYTTVFHELIHTIGGYHEQNNYKRDAFATLLINNIIEYYQKAFKPVFTEDSDIVTYSYDWSSPSIYTPYGTSRTGFPIYGYMYGDMYVNDQNRVFLDEVAREINKIYNCWDMHSCGTKPECYHEGYPGWCHHECGCVCPVGLDESSNCSSVKVQPTGGSWPDSNMKMLKTTAGCPLGFTESTVTVEEVIDGSSNMNNGASSTIQYEFVTDTLTLHFCSKPSAANDLWGNGYIGFLASNNGCPSGVEEENVTFSATNGAETQLDFCLQQGIYTEPIKGLPTDSSFAVFSRSNDYCQEIDGFVSNLGYISISHSNDIASFAGSFPIYEFPDVNDKKTLKLFFCSYEPLDYSCGEVIELTSSKVIVSPNHPGVYPKNTECNWIIYVEEGARIKAEFSSFNIDEHDSFTHRTYILNSLDSKLSNGNSLPQNLVSVYNRMAFRLRTGAGGSEPVTATGFNLTVTRLGAEDYCYSLADRGESYNGNWSYAIDGSKCLPWFRRFDDNITISGYADFNGTTSTFLTGSACRNPQGRLDKPACLTYVNEGNYTLQYCDVCHIEYGIRDFSDYCSDGVDTDPSICTGPSGGKCLKTCMDRGHITTVTIPPTVGEVTCPTPTMPSSPNTAVQNSETVKSVYHPGDVIQIDCVSSSKKVNFTCLSTGSWPEWNEPCTGCLPGWAQKFDKCYKMIGYIDNWYKAKKYCETKFDGAYLMSPNTTEQHDFFLSWRASLGKTVQWWMGGDYDTRWRWNIDDTSMNMDVFGWPSDTDGGKRTCVVHNVWLKWKAGVCNDIFNFICEKPLEGPRSYTDRTKECAAALEENPEVCLEPVVNTNACPYTCGANVKGYPPSLTNGYMIDNKILLPGETVEYKCNLNFENQGGSLTRAYTRQGTFTGSPPVCTPKLDALKPVYDLPIKKFRTKTNTLTVYTGESIQFLITRDGRIHAWEISCECYGTIEMQVWRMQSPSTSYQLIGKNTIQCFPGILRNVPIAEADRISVEDGDRIGFIDVTGGCFTYYPCNEDYMPQYYNVHYKYVSQYSTMTTLESPFNYYCMVFAVNSIVGS